MSKLSIYETGWINLVFEGRNKEYGAYQLRQENSKTTSLAFLFGLFFVASLFGGSMLLSSFGNKPTVKTDVPFFVEDSVHLTKVVFKEFPPKSNTTKPKVQTTIEQPAQPLLNNPVVTQASQPVDDVGKNNQATPNPDDHGTPGGTGTGPDTPTTTPATPTTTVPTTNEPFITAAVDAMPEYPGGVKKFIDYIAYNFEKPEIEISVSVLMSFVVEKDGSMTDIKVLRNPGYGLDKEAIRVLKSMKTKWKPGVKDGKPVRVLYTLPIKIQPQ